MERLLNTIMRIIQYPSCLIIGTDINDNIIHIVCGMNNNLVFIITAYHPDSDEWEEDMKTRREE